MVLLLAILLSCSRLRNTPNIKILTEKDFIITQVMKDTTTAWEFHNQEDLQYSLIGGYHAISDKRF